MNDKTRTKEEIAIELAQLSGLDHQRFDLVHARGLHSSKWSDGIFRTIEGRRLELVREYEKLGGNVYSVSISGEGGEGCDHYDLDAAIEVRFGDKVVCDSDNEVVYIDVVPSALGAVMDKLNELDPDGHFSARDLWKEVDAAEDGFYQIPGTDMCGSWTTMAKFLVDRGVEQEVLDISGAPPVSPKQIEEAWSEIEKAIYKRHPQLTPEKMADLLPLVEELLDGFVDWVDAEL